MAFVTYVPGTAVSLAIRTACTDPRVGGRSRAAGPGPEGPERPPPLVCAGRSPWCLGCRIKGGAREKAPNVTGCLHARVVRRGRREFQRLHLSVASHILQAATEHPSARAKGRVRPGRANPPTSEEAADNAALGRKHGLLGGARAHGRARSLVCTDGAHRWAPPGCTHTALPDRNEKALSSLTTRAEAAWLPRGASCPGEPRCEPGCSGGRCRAHRWSVSPWTLSGKGPSLERVSRASASTHTPRRQREPQWPAPLCTWQGRGTPLVFPAGRSGLSQAAAGHAGPETAAGGRVQDLPL